MPDPTKPAPKPLPPHHHRPSIKAEGDGFYLNVDRHHLHDSTTHAVAKVRLFSWNSLVVSLTYLAIGLLLGFTIAILIPLLATATPDPATPAGLAAMPDSATPLAPGPWGNLEALPTYIEPPDEYLPTSNIEAADSRWRFSRMTRDQLLALFEAANLTSAQKAELTDTSKWQQAGSAIYIKPSKDTILSLSPESRKKIYVPILADRESVMSMLSRSCPTSRLNNYLARSGLPDETIDLVRKLSFSYGNQTIFADLPTVLATLPTSDQKVRLLKTLLRYRTMLLRLHLTPTSNVAEIEHYWIKAGWGLDLRPMIESLAALPHGARMDVVELFPPIPSSHIYTYSFPSLKPQDQYKDCRWTSLNFFRDIPDDRFTDSSVVRQTLETDYYPALTDPRYGDLVLLCKPDGDVIHMAVYIAADIVYTKNSGNFRDPYILMSMADMIDHFAVQIPEDQTLQIKYYRNKYY